MLTPNSPALSQLQPRSSHGPCKSTRFLAIHALRGRGILSSRGAGDGRVSLWQTPLAFPKFNHQWLPLQIVPVHQQHGVLGRLNICNKRAKWVQVTQQVLAQTHTMLTQTFLAHRPSAHTATQCGAGILQPERYAE